MPCVKTTILAIRRPGRVHNAAVDGVRNHMVLSTRLSVVELPASVSSASRGGQLGFKHKP